MNSEDISKMTKFTQIGIQGEKMSAICQIINFKINTDKILSK